MKIESVVLGLSVLVLSSASALAAPGPVPASLECTESFVSPAAAKKLVIHHAPGNVAHATLSTAEGQQTFEGTYGDPVRVFLGRQTKYSLSGEAGSANLSVSYSASSSRGGCGRGGCDDLPAHSKYSIYATLELGGQSLDFSCHETARN